MITINNKNTLVYFYKNIDNNQKFFPAKIQKQQQELPGTSNFKSLWDIKGLSFGELGEIGEITIKEPVTPEYQEDEKYRKKLAEALKAEYGITASPEELRSVMGAEELKFILAEELNPENFSTGENFENVRSGKFKVNLHMHTGYSDGTMSVEQLLGQAAAYADYRADKLGKADPVIVAVTDHDMLDGAKEAIKLIAQNPEKYKNIRFVPGIEFNTFYKIQDDSGNTDKRQFEVLGYCINPFETNQPEDRDVAKFVKKGRTQNEDYLKEIIAELNKWEEAAGVSLTDIGEFKASSRYASILGSPGFMNGIKEGLAKTFERKKLPDKDNKINEICERHIQRYGNWGVNSGTPDVEKIAEVVNSSGAGFIGIAHPARNFNNPELKAYLDLGKLFPEFKQMGVEAAEVNYRYADTHGVNEFFRAYIKNSAEKSGMLKTGGHDNHKDNIFTNSKQFENLPGDIKGILTGN